MILIINTANKEYLEIALAEDSDSFDVKKIEGEYRQAEQLLPAIDNILKEKNKNISDISGVGVVSGPGGFTSLRIGVVTANTLGYALSISVVGITLDEFGSDKELVANILNKLNSAKVGNVVIPEYGREPNIS